MPSRWAASAPANRDNPNAIVTCSTLFRRQVAALHAQSLSHPDPAPEARQKLAQSARTGSPVSKSSERRRRDTRFSNAQRTIRLVSNTDRIPLS
jgi:hypothetical protein